VVLMLLILMMLMVHLKLMLLMLLMLLLMLHLSQGARRWMSSWNRVAGSKVGVVLRHGCDWRAILIVRGRSMWTSLLRMYSGRSWMVLLLHYLDRLAWLPCLSLPGELMWMLIRLHVLMRVRRSENMLLWMVLLLMLNDDRLTRVVMRLMGSMRSVHLGLPSRKASEASVRRRYGQIPRSSNSICAHWVAGSRHMGDSVDGSPRRSEVPQIGGEVGREQGCGKGRKGQKRPG
jgi:hypothetical protein